MHGGARWLAVGAAFAATATPCAAQTAYQGGTPDRLTLTVNVRASIAARCGFLPANPPGANYVEPNFDTAGFDRTASFKLDCTSASRVGVVSANGGLLKPGGAPGAGYTATAPYDVQLTLVGNTANATATCGAKDLVPASNACAPTYIPVQGANFAGPASASKGLLLSVPATNGSNSTIRLKANAYAGTAILAAGNYADTLTVTISPAA